MSKNNFSSRSYFSFLLKSKGRHGVHSPFVYQFVDTCLTAKLDKSFINSRKKFYSTVKKDKAEITVNDLGVGSKKLKRMRSVLSLFQNASSKGIYGDVIQRISQFYQPTTVLELGTSIGIGTFHLSAGENKPFIISVEGCENTFRKAMEFISLYENKNVLLNCPFDEFLATKSVFFYDIIFIDGNHNGTSLLEYITKLQPYSHNETIWIIDDIRWSDDMWEAWNTLILQEEFHLSIDLGRMGLLWKRTQQTKEHFFIRPVTFKTRFF